MSATLLAWLGIAGVLAIRSFARPSYAVALYMLTFFAHPQFWWWGDPIEGYRWNFFSALLLIATLVLTSAGSAMKREKPLNSSAVVVLAVMAANCVLVHLLLAVNADSSFGWLIIRLKFILLFFLLQYAIKDEKDYRIVSLAIALGMGYIGYEATINERGSFSGGRLEGVGAAGIQSSNQLASLLITGLPLATAVLFTTAPRWLKGVTLVAAGFTFNVVLMCNSRGAFLGVILAGVTFIALASGPARKRSMKLAAVAAIGAFMLLGDARILDRFASTFTGASERDNSAQSRIVFWTAASRMIADYPLGSGGNSFSEGRGWQYMSQVAVEGNTRAVHNGFLTEMTSWGVQGFAILLVLFYRIGRTILRGRRLALDAGNTNAMMVFGCLAASMVAWLVSSFFGDYLDEEWGFWTAAMVYAYLRVHVEAPASEQSAPPATFTPRPALPPVARRVSA